MQFYYQLVRLFDKDIDRLGDGSNFIVAVFRQASGQVAGTQLIQCGKGALHGLFQTPRQDENECPQGNGEQNQRYNHQP